MNKRRMRLLIILVGSTIIGVLGLHLFEIDWKLYGWLRGEPFCKGLPASYYAGRIRAAWVIRTDLRGSVRQRPPTLVEAWLRRHRAVAIADVISPDHIDSNESPKPFQADTPDTDKLPVLVKLLDDSDFRVRWWSSQKLARMKGEAAQAIRTIDPDSLR
jgi:hypothetical protein